MLYSLLVTFCVYAVCITKMSSKIKGVVLSMADKAKNYYTFKQMNVGKQLAETFNVGTSTNFNIKKNRYLILTCFLASEICPENCKNH